MNGRSAPALVAAAVLVVTALAGCIQPPDWLQSASTKGEISAMEDRDLADNAAKAWSPHATLLSVFTIELGDNDGQDNIPLDAHVGNGKAPVWFYVYCAGDPKDDAAPADNETGGNGTRSYASEESTSTSSSMSQMLRAFRVTADGRVEVENDSQMPPMTGSMGDMHDLAEWKVDSTQALDAARSNETFRKAAEAPNATIAEGVAYMDGKTGWYFAAASKAGMAVALVDAATGKLLQVTTMDLDFAIPSYARAKAAPEIAPPLRQEGKGTVSPDKPKKEFPFAWDGGATVAQLKVNYDGRTPMDGVAWKLVGPDGKEVKPQGSSSSDAMMGGRSNGAVRYALAQAGDYKLVFQYRGPLDSIPVPDASLGSTDFSFVLSNQIAHAQEH